MNDDIRNTIVCCQTRECKFWMDALPEATCNLKLVLISSGACVSFEMREK